MLLLLLLVVALVLATVLLLLGLLLLLLLVLAPRCEDCLLLLLLLLLLLVKAGLVKAAKACSGKIPGQETTGPEAEHQNSHQLRAYSATMWDQRQRMGRGGCKCSTLALTACQHAEENAD